MSTVTEQPELEPRGPMWPIVAVLAAAILAVAPLYMEVLVMHARLAAAEQSVEKLVGRAGAGAIVRSGR